MQIILILNFEFELSISLEFAAFLFHGEQANTAADNRKLG